VVERRIRAAALSRVMDDPGRRHYHDTGIRWRRRFATPDATNDA